MISERSRVSKHPLIVINGSLLNINGLDLIVIARLGRFFKDLHLRPLGNFRPALHDLIHETKLL